MLRPTPKVATKVSTATGIPHEQARRSAEQPHLRNHKLTQTIPVSVRNRNRLALGGPSIPGLSSHRPTSFDGFDPISFTYPEGHQRAPEMIASIPAKADPTAQQRFLDTELTLVLDEAKAGRHHVFFFDGHFGWLGSLVTS